MNEAKELPLPVALCILGAFTGSLLLAGCATTPTEPVIQTVEVRTPVPVSCVPRELGAAPEYADTDEALRQAGSADRRYQLVIAGREQRTARLGEIEPVVDACRRVSER